MCILIRTPNGVEDPEKEGKRKEDVQTWLSPLSHTPLYFHVQTWGRKNRRRSSEKADNCTLPWPSFFGFSLSLAIKNVHTYPHTKWVEDPEKAGSCTLPWPSSFGSSLSLAIKNVHLYAHQNTPSGAKNVCIHGGWKKRGRRREKKKEKEKRG